MAYRDPYTTTGAGSRYDPHQQAYPSYTTPEYNPYEYNQNAGGVGYNNAPYSDEPRHYNDYDSEYDNTQATTNYPPRREPSQKTYLTKEKPVGVDEGFDPAGFAFPREKFVNLQSRTVSALKAYRYDHRGNLWTRGGRGRCIGRFCCCTLMTAILLIVCIVLTLALWVRPPGIEIGNIQPTSQNGSPFTVESDGLTINLGVNISIDNPNYFAVSFKQIKAEIFYPTSDGNDTAIGGGNLTDVVFHSHSEQNITFPFSIDYKTSLDPQSLILVDIGTKCGVIGSSKSDITVNYKITLGLKILFVTISPTVQNTVSFACPIDDSEIQALKALLGSAGGLSSLTGSG
ncbi:hypothetical protein BDQ17DRAFT_1396083 [Cyathus striatus]|nr:hypothetical protein BDQ17DRAFT_1396083 [Cyathus striatus]